MKAHIQQTIADLDADILQLNDLKRFLLARYGADDLPVPLPPLARLNTDDLKEFKVGTDAPKPKGTKRKIKHTPRAPKCTNRELLEAGVAKMQPPITAVRIVEIVGGDMKMAANIITKLSGKKWLKKVGRGAYERTALFPGGGVAPATAPKAPSLVNGGNGRTQRTPGAVSTELREGSIEREVYYAAKHAPQEFTAMSIAISTGRSLDSVRFALRTLKLTDYVKEVSVEDGEPVWKLAK